MLRPDALTATALGRVRKGAKCAAGVEETFLQKQESDAGYSDYLYFIVPVRNRVRYTIVQLEISLTFQPYELCSN
jgi:hypothetical protein